MYDPSIMYMLLDAQASEIMCMIDGSYIDYLDEYGCITVELLQALYGCIQSAALWYGCFKSAILDFGFTAIPSEKCVFKYTNQDEFI